MKLNRSGLLLLIPGALVFTGLFLLPMAGLLEESFRKFVPGRIGSVEGTPLTLANYRELLVPSSLGYVADTFRISLLSTIAGLVIAYPVAYWIARRMQHRVRALCLGTLVTLLFLSVLVRTYALELTFGTVSPLRPALDWLGISPNDSLYIEVLVGAGLLQYIIPMSALMLLGTLQNLNPRLVDAAQSLGATAWKAHLTITLPLSVRGLLSAFLVSFTFSISAFVIPMILGKGRVQFLSNLIYNRISQIANYPSGAAVSMATLVISMLIIFIIAHAFARMGRTQVRTRES